MLAFSERIADILIALVRSKGEADDPNPTIEALTEALGKRSFGIVLVLFGLPNLLPIPGLPMICGLVIGIVGLQMTLGAQSVKLPRWLGARRIRRAELARLVARAEPGLRMLERVTRPRLEALTRPSAQRALGLVLVLLGLALQAPIPFFGGIAPGLAVVLLALALTERDGLLLIVGLFVSLLALVFTFTITYAIVRQVVLFVLRATGLL